MFSFLHVVKNLANIMMAFVLHVSVFSPFYLLKSQNEMFKFVFIWSQTLEQIDSQINKCLL